MLPIGIHRDIPIEEYNAHPAIRSSHLKILLDEMPADLKYALDNFDSQNEKLSPSLLKGLVLHTMVLEPHMEDQRYVFETEDLGDKRSGEAKKAWDKLKKLAAESKRTVVPYEIYRDCKGMAAAVLASPDLKGMHERARKEETLIAEINEVWCKVRLDAFLHHEENGWAILDLKTTANGLSDREIGNTIAEFKFHFSAAMYVKVARALGLDVKGFAWIFIQSKAPYQHRIVDATEEMLERGELEFDRCLEIYKASVLSKTWKAHDPKVSTVDFPSWYLNRTYPFGKLTKEEPVEQPETVE